MTNKRSDELSKELIKRECQSGFDKLEHCRNSYNESWSDILTTELTATQAIAILGYIEDIEEILEELPDDLKEDLNTLIEGNFYD